MAAMPEVQSDSQFLKGIFLVCTARETLLRLLIPAGWTSWFHGAESPLRCFSRR
jgi:hypothetical protein